METEKPKLEDVIEDIKSREGWPHGPTDKPPRLFKIKIGDTIENMNLAQLLNVSGAILDGRVQVGKGQRQGIARQLLSVMDRFLEFQYLYDKTIPTELEYDQLQNPQRFDGGLLMTLEVPPSKLPEIQKTLVELTPPFPLRVLMTHAHPLDMVKQVHRLKFTYLNPNLLNVNCVLKIERIQEQNTQLVNVPVQKQSDLEPPVQPPLTQH